MKRFIATIITLVLISSLAVYADVADAKGFSSGSRSSGSSFKSSGSSYKSTPKTSTTTKSTTTKPKSSITTKKTTPKKKTSTMAFTPPSSQLNGHSFNGRDIFMTAAGTYVIYNAVDSFADCDYDDIMEGDGDCEEYELTDDELEDLGIESDDDDYEGEELSDEGAKILLTIFLIFIGIVIILGIVLFVHERNQVKKRRKRRGW